MVKNLPASAGEAGDVRLVPGSGRSPGLGNGNLLQYSCLENPVGRGGYSPWGLKELDITERLSSYTTQTHTKAGMGWDGKRHLKNDKEKKLKMAPNTMEP